MFNKKFKVRVKHFAECKYTVQYAYYRFIPVWHSLCFWFHQGHPGGTECWSIDLWNVETAERIASSLKTINDVKEYYKPLEEEEAKWRIAEKEYWQKNAPYASKEF